MAPSPRRTRDPRELLPLSAHALQILLVLSEHEHHGYALLDAIEARTKGEMRLGTSTLYASLTRLQKEGAIAECATPADVDSEDARRRYYRATPFGLEVLREEARRIRRLDQLLTEARVLEPAASRGRGGE